MSEHPSEFISFDRLADSFIARLRKGERPGLTEYVDRYPEHAEDIVDLFPALAEMECLKPEPDAATGSFVADFVNGCDTPHPTQMGDYRILRLIGQGGMGVVYEARRESLSAHVALKVLHRRFQAQSGFLSRFRNEARAAARLHHTNIVPVFDFGDHDGILYYVMQYIPGQGLDRVMEDVKLLRESGTSDRPTAGPSARLARSVAEGLLTGHFDIRGQGQGPGLSPDSTEAASTIEPRIRAAARPPRPPSAESSGVVSTLGGEATGAGQSRYHREIARIGAQVADALAHAHSLGILHRDVKPPNLLLDARGNAWVTDFGLAKCEDGEAALTDPGDVLGTLRYMAPERFSGHSDRRGDTYALGVTLYEMLALRPAFNANDRALLVRQILHDEPPPLRKLDPRVPRDLETILRKAMAKEIASRYASAAEMAEDLRLYLEDRPLKNARRTRSSERAFRWCRRNPLVAALGVAAGALLLTVVTVATTAAIREKKSNEDLGRELVNLEAERKEKTKQVERAQNAELQSNEKLWEAKLATARASRYSNRSGRRFDALAALAQAAELGRQLGHSPDRFAKLRNEAIAALAQSDLQITKEFGSWTSELVSVDVNANFDLFATSDYAGRGIVRRVADDVEVARLPQATRPRVVSFGGDRWLADVDHSGPRKVRIWDISTPEPKIRVDDPTEMATLDFRLDGDLVAILHTDGSLTTYEMPTGKKRHSLPRRPIPQDSLIRLHPSLPYLVLTSVFSTSASLIHLETGKAVEVKLPWADGQSSQAEWSDDGRTLAIPGSEGQGVALFEFAGDPPLARLIRKGVGVARKGRIALNRAGDRLFSRGDNHSTVMHDWITGRMLFTPPGFIALSVGTPTLKIDRERRRLFPARVNDPVRRFGYYSVAEGQETRLIVPDSSGTSGFRIGISPDGRLAMGVSSQKVVLYDIDGGREIGSIPFGDLGTWNFYVSFDPSGCLLTNTFGGCFRWPIRPDPTAPGTVVIGPPERLGLVPFDNQSSMNRDGKVIAQVMMSGYVGGPQAGGWLLNTSSREPARNLHPGIQLGQTSVTPDGKWVMFGGSPGPVFVHDTETGKMVWSRPGLHGQCQFSPDGKWLGTDMDNGRLFAVGTWQPGPQLGHGHLSCFSPDGTMAVLSTGEGPFRLVEVATGREIARFDDPDRGNDHAALSEDNATLVTRHAEGLRVWDLRLIRSELSRIGLDWDAPAFAPRAKPEGPLAVKVVGVDLLDPKSAASRTQRILNSLRAGKETDAVLTSADELIQGGWHDLGLVAYNAAIRRHPASGHLRMHRAMELFGRGRWQAAIDDFRLALEREPTCKFRDQARIRLAVAYHELGKHADAASTLAKDLESPADTRQPIEKAGLRVLLAEFFDLDGKPDLAIKQREAAATLYPKTARAANHLAWEWLMPKGNPTLGTNERNAPAALLLARKAVNIEPGEPMFGNTYGLALYRAGHITEARSVLEANLMLGQSKTDAWDLFILAMCQHHLGDRKAARDSYDRAVAWTKAHADKFINNDAQDIAKLQAEAGRILGATN